MRLAVRIAMIWVETCPRISCWIKERSYDEDGMKFILSPPLRNVRAGQTVIGISVVRLTW